MTERNYWYLKVIAKAARKINLGNMYGIDSLPTPRNCYKVRFTDHVC